MVIDYIYFLLFSFMHAYFQYFTFIHVLFWRRVYEFGIALDMLQVVGDILVMVAELERLIEDARSRVPEILRFSSTFFSRALVPTGARCYHIYSSQATIFYFSDTVHFFSQIYYIWDVEMSSFDGSLFYFWTIALSHVSTESQDT